MRNHAVVGGELIFGLFYTCAIVISNVYNGTVG